MELSKLKKLLDSLEEKYNQVGFIEDDPVSVPHRFETKQDIEIAGFFAAIFAWGQRKTIINKSLDLLNRMDHAPYDFVLNHSGKDLKRLESFVHRTFNFTDLSLLLKFFQAHYQKHVSLETLFVHPKGLEHGLEQFRASVLELPHEKRSEKHLPSPLKKSACKRINMYLRWMVRKDNRGVDFGIWNSISPSELYLPLDVHVLRTAIEFGLLDEKAKADWNTCNLLTEKMRTLCPEDPVKYDFSLFGFGIEQRNER